MSDSLSEQEILARYSTPGLRRNELTRAGKKWHLQGFTRITSDEIEEILDRLYPGESPNVVLDAVANEEAA
jgi:hypothetical protein